MSKLICPVCNTPSPFTPIFLSDDSVYDFVVGTEEASKYSGIVKAKMPEFMSGMRYAIIYCQSCEGLFIAAEEIGQGEWFVAYPITHKTIGSGVPELIKSEFEEASLCLTVGANQACVATCQIALESLWRNKEVSGLNQLHKAGIISKSLFDKATEIRLWAGVTKHELVNELIDPDDAEQLLVYLETILNDVYVEPKRLEELKRTRGRLGNK